MPTSKGSYCSFHISKDFSFHSFVLCLLSWKYNNDNVFRCSQLYQQSSNPNICSSFYITQSFEVNIMLLEVLSKTKKACKELLREMMMMILKTLKRSHLSLLWKDIFRFFWFGLVILVTFWTLAFFWFIIACYVLVSLNFF